jgi:hypothetical protein
VEYVFVLRGRMARTLESALEPASALERGDSTELRFEIDDDSRLYGILAKMERLGLSIESFEPVGHHGTSSGD